MAPNSDGDDSGLGPAGGGISGAGDVGDYGGFNSAGEPNDPTGGLGMSPAEYTDMVNSVFGFTVPTHAFRQSYVPGYSDLPSSIAQEAVENIDRAEVLADGLATTSPTSFAASYVTNPMTHVDPAVAAWSHVQHTTKTGLATRAEMGPRVSAAINPTDPLAEKMSPIDAYNKVAKEIADEQRQALKDSYKKTEETLVEDQRMFSKMTPMDQRYRSPEDVYGPAINAVRQAQVALSAQQIAPGATVSELSDKLGTIDQVGVMTTMEAWGPAQFQDSVMSGSMTDLDSMIDISTPKSSMEMAMNVLSSLMNPISVPTALMDTLMNLTATPAQLAAFNTMQRNANLVGSALNTVGVGTTVADLMSETLANILGPLTSHVGTQALGAAVTGLSGFSLGDVTNVQAAADAAVSATADPTGMGRNDGRGAVTSQLASLNEPQSISPSPSSEKSTLDSSDGDLTSGLSYADMGTTSGPTLKDKVKRVKVTKKSKEKNKRMTSDAGINWSKLLLDTV